MYSWYPQMCIRISSNVHYDILKRAYYDISPMYWAFLDVLMISLQCILCIPQCTHDIPLMYSWYPQCTGYPQCTYHFPMYCICSNVVCISSFHLSNPREIMPRISDRLCKTWPNSKLTHLSCNWNYWAFPDVLMISLQCILGIPWYTGYPNILTISRCIVYSQTLCAFLVSTSVIHVK